MRGKAIDIGPIHGELGITPAYAGKSCRPEAAVPDLRDHPRVCGEKKVMRGAKDKRMGSPPRMRGKVADDIKKTKAYRITPAYAGKSQLRFCMQNLSGDHPRVCGEKMSWACCMTARLGSPPRMRGKVILSAVGKSSGGITPAYAGKREIKRRCCVASQDHPRVCGEKFR